MVQEVRGLRMGMMKRAANQGDSKGSGRQAGLIDPKLHQPIPKETDGGSGQGPPLTTI